MTRTHPDIGDAIIRDPFRESLAAVTRPPFQLLGGEFRFESNSEQLLRLVDVAYAGLPRHRLDTPVPRMRVRLELTAAGVPRRRRAEPAPLRMFSGAGFLGGAAGSASFAVFSERERTALVCVPAVILRFPYHTRYELVEFAVFTLAARVQRLVPLHAACLSHAGRAVLLMGGSGAGKSTLALHWLVQGLEFVSEDSVFAHADSLRATGIANFLHVRPDSLKWLGRTPQAAAIRRSPVIRRRSGVRKFEVDLRRHGYHLAATAPKLAGVIFLSAQSAGSGPLLRPLSAAKASTMMAAEQGYAAGQPQWRTFQKGMARLDSFVLRRGRHPLEATEALHRYLASAARHSD
jgi:hypothetical protein